MENIMKVVRMLVATVMVAGAASMALVAHDMVFKGTVSSIKNDKIEVKVIDEKTQKESPMTFQITDKTKVFRGEHEVKFADAHVQKNERIAVTVNHDVSATKATVVRLAAHQPDNH